MKVEIRTAHRHGYVEAVEEPARIVLRIELSRKGALPDQNEVTAAIAKLLWHYRGDERPIVLRDPITGYLAFVGGSDARAKVEFRRTH
jgi:hypothetical protein